MTQISASYRSVQAEITSVQLSAQQKSTSAYRRSGQGAPSSSLTTPERQIIDGLDISDQAIKKLEAVQELAKQLQDYLGFLKGKSLIQPPRISAPQGDPDVVIAGQETNLAASITKGSYIEETLDISVDIDEDGNISELTVSYSKMAVEFVKADFILEDNQFFAAYSQ